MSRFGRVAPVRPTTVNPGSATVAAPSPIASQTARLPLASQVPRQAIPQAQPISGIEGFALILVLADIFFTFSRILEVYSIKAGPLSLAMAVRAMSFLAAILCGRMIRTTHSPISIRMILFTVWLFITVPFSSWRGGSADVMFRYWMPGLLGYLAIDTLLNSSKTVRKALLAISFSSVVILIMTFTMLQTIQDRWGVDTASLGNPNDLALMLLIGMPGIWLVISQRGWPMPFRVALVVVGILMLRAVSNTGSRSGMFTLLVFFAITLFWATPMNRLKTLLVGFLGVCIFFATASRISIQRYLTVIPFVSVEPLTAKEQKETESAEASREAREDLFRESINLTLRNPILGVGPGTFTSAAAGVSREESRRASWHESHNTYTQVSSETGIPGFILYLMLMWASFRSVIKIRKKVRGIAKLEYLDKIAASLLLMLACFAISAFFSSMAYLSLFPFLLAIADAFDRSANREIADHEKCMSNAVFAAKPRLS